MTANLLRSIITPVLIGYYVCTSLDQTGNRLSSFDAQTLVAKVGELQSQGGKGEEP
jgi:uncharacterized protein YodC (DUF2158 family)